MKRLIVILAALLLMACAALAAEGPKAGEVDPKTGKVIKYWVAPMDPAYIRDTPGKSPMGMDLVPVYQDQGGEKEPTSTIRIDPVTVQNMGVRTGKVRRAPLSKSIRALGSVTFDETRMYAVNTKFDGWIEKLYVDFVGETVKKGQPLFEIYSPEVVTAQEEYRLALDQVASLGHSAYPSVRANAERLREASRKRLSYWDLSESQIRRLEQGGQVRKTVTVYSPESGVVIKKDALLGHFVKAGMHQYDIADLSRVWVDVEVFEYELPFMRKGMPARMELSYMPGKTYSGKVLFIYPFLNPKTRTVRLRLEFPNPDNKLKPDMYANVFLQAQIDPAALVIPQEAVIDSGVRKLVFVAQGKGRFEPREVRIGAEGDDGNFQVLSGLGEGEEIVLSAQFMMDSESRLREAIQKMLGARATGGPSADELDMDDMDMAGDELKMDELKMDGQDMGKPPVNGTPAQ
ncbi:MAG: efflux RND transporter periplasmic adaptor subunit [Proteobacteria bacterium]|nr:efflux RND transporter periplasmic adaptor subunit [Pseudomonadota bacterium]